MDEDEYMNRFKSLVADVDINSLKTQSPSKRDSLIDEIDTKFRDFFNNCNGDVVTKDFVEGNGSIEAIGAYIDSQFQKEEKPQVIMVDYLNLVVADENKNTTAYEKYKRIAEQLRGLSNKYSVPI